MSVEPSSHAASDQIRVRGARMHNLQDVQVDIPRDELIVVTGPSGSGKSSLAFDTLHAEGQRQYIETLSPYVRQYLSQMERPDVDEVEGLPPTICIDQRVEVNHPRSTVATITEVYDYLRILMARLGTVYCHVCQAEIAQQSVAQIQDQIQQLPEGTKLMILAPLVRGRRGAHRDALLRLRKLGFVRARIDGTLHDLEEIPEIEPRKAHDIDGVIDRIIVRAGTQSRISESVRLAAEHGEGRVVTWFALPEEPNRWQENLYSTRYACPECNTSYLEVEPRTFSFNSPYGVCPVCEGWGEQEQFDLDSVIPDLDRSISKGVIVPWRSAPSTAEKKFLSALESFLKTKKLSSDTPLSAWSLLARERLWAGDDKFPGVRQLLQDEFETTKSSKRREQLEWFRQTMACPACQGSRLREESRHVRVADRAIHEITGQSIQAAREWFAQLTWSKHQAPIAEPLLREIQKRLSFLDKVGVGYLTLDRAADTLSGGELQRVRLATSIGSGLVGVCYVLDEPSIGLHPRDNDRLLAAIRELQELGNTVVLVEHDLATIKAADHIIDLGPGAGEEGGRVIAEGTADEIRACPESITGNFLAGSKSIPVPRKRRRASKSRSIFLEGASHNNLQDVSAQFPLGTFICVTGVSGSGKSSLVNETLAPALSRRLGIIAKPGPYRSMRGASQVDKLIRIDQKPIGRTPRSNPATYTGLFDEIRKVFANTRDARQRGYRSSRFSFNVKGGRCETCQGQGMQKFEMHFLPDLYVTCDQCKGARFNPQTLQILYRDHSIADILTMRVAEARTFFENFTNISRCLQAMYEVGLGYLPLGQPSTTLSGGEAQRIKLATELSRVDTGNTVYVLDEPTTGLHLVDIRRLLHVLQQLVDKGNTVIVIEHHLDVIKSADWIVDLGPDGGVHGGQLVAMGTPQQIAGHPQSSTGQFLKEVLREGS